MTRLHELYRQQGQSPWLDNLKRAYLRSGRLPELVRDGVRGVTSNPTIFAKAIEGSDEYDEQFSSLLKSHSVEEAYWELVVRDIEGALEVLRPTYDESDGTDGFVSIEVAPALAHDKAGSVAAASHLHERIDEPNLFVKIPATAEGVRAIETMIGRARSINVTLIFSLERYGEVIDAYMSGLEKVVADGKDPTRVASVASFFVSRVDTEVDRRLEKLAGEGGGPEDVLDLRGRAAIAQAKLAYELFEERFSSSRWKRLEEAGARVQRPLWASTSTKNPAYPDLNYVDNLIGPRTVNTMPEETLLDFLDHGTVARTVDRDVDADREVLDRLAEVGVDMADVARQLEEEGVASFSKAFDELLSRLSDKANALDAS